MREIYIDDSGNTSETIGFDGKTEPQRQEESKAELISEQFGTPQPLILGKFTSSDALATSYANLEAEAGRLRAEIATLRAGAKPAEGATVETTIPDSEATPPAGDPPATPAPAPATPPATPPAAAPAAPATGLPPEQQERILSSILAQAGGEQEFDKLATWATHNLPQDRLDRFNNALTTGNEADALTALKAFQFDRLNQMGYEPQLLGGARTLTSQDKPFASEVEVTTAMNDPRYMGPDADPAYVQSVMERLNASGLFG